MTYTILGCVEDNQRIGSMLQSMNSPKFDDLWYIHYCLIRQCLICAYIKMMEYSNSTPCCYTSRCWNLSVIPLFIVSWLLAHAAEANLSCSIYSKKSITCGSVHGHPRGASGPATQPRWPPLGVTIIIQFEFSWGNNTKLSCNVCLQAQTKYIVHALIQLNKRQIQDLNFMGLWFSEPIVHLIFCFTTYYLSLSNVFLTRILGSQLKLLDSVEPPHYLYCRFCPWVEPPIVVSSLNYHVMTSLCQQV